MDRKSIIGLILIFLVFMGYMWWTAPSEEELAAQRAMRDSIMRVEQLRIDSLEKAQAMSVAQTETIENQLKSSNDSVRNATLPPHCPNTLTRPRATFFFRPRIFKATGCHLVHLLEK